MESNSWREVKLSDLGEVARGRSRHRPRYAEHLYGGKYPFIQTGDVKASEGRIYSHEQTYSDAGLAQSRLWPVDTMCITIAANIAETGILQYPACFPDSVIGFIADKNKADVYFIEYVFRQLRKDIQRQATGSVQDNINLQTLDRLRFKVPSVEEQKKIANFLNCFDEKIILNRQINQTTEQMAQALFKSWFVDFDPVVDNALDAGFFEQDLEFSDELLRHAEARKAARESADFKPLPENIRQLFPEAFEESPDPTIGLSGWMPKAWGTNTISEIAFVNKESWTKNNAPQQIKYVDLSNAKDGIILDIQKYSFEEAPNRARRVLNKKDTIFGMVRPANRSFAFVDRDGLTGSTGFVVLTAKNMNTSCFIYQKLTSDYVVDELIRVADGAAYPAIKPDDISELLVVLPDKSILGQFEKIIGGYRERIAHNLESNEQLAKLRDTLLPKLISGELRLIDSEVDTAEEVLE